MMSEFGILSLRELFPDEDYRFHLTLRRGNPRDFFRQHDSTGAVLAERARWLREDRPRYAALLPEGQPLLAEFADLCSRLAVAGAPPVGARTDPGILGASLEPDFLLLSPQPSSP